MAPQRKVLDKQLELLVNYLEENREMIKGLSNSSNPVNTHLRAKWAIVAKRLNSVPGGMFRTPYRWRRYWAEWRHKIVKKAFNIRRRIPNNKFSPLTNLDMKVLELTGNHSVKNMSLSLSNQSKETDNNCASGSERHITPQSLGRNNSLSDNIGNYIKEDDAKYPAASNRETSPPRWALELEEKRIIARERVAFALESVATILEKQSEEYNKNASLFEVKLKDILSNLTKTLHKVNGGLQNAVDIIRNNSDCSDNHLSL